MSTDMRGGAIYAHFLDRELTASVGARLGRNAIVQCLVYSALLGQRVYCSLSAIWEHSSIDDHVRLVIRELVASDLLWTVSNHPTAEDFLDSRRKLYEFDRRRYPNYFESPARPTARLWTPSQYRSSSSTARLSVTLTDRVALLRPDLASPVHDRLTQRDGRAITMALFRKIGPDKADQQQVGQAISFLYAQQYVEWLSAGVLVGVPGLSFFDDSLSPEPTVTSWRLVHSLLRVLGWGDFVLDLAGLHRPSWLDFIEACSVNMVVLSSAWAALLAETGLAVPGGSSLVRQTTVEYRIQAALIRADQRVRRVPPRTPRDAVVALVSLLLAAQEQSAAGGWSPMVSLAVPQPQPPAVPATVDLGLLESRKQTRWTRIGAIAAVLGLLVAVLALCSSDNGRGVPDTPSSTVTSVPAPQVRVHD